MMKCHLPVLLVLAVVGMGSVSASPSSAMLERDWLRQLDLRFGREAYSGAIVADVDAIGGVDGVIDGQWGFHTQSEPNPWWRVDLGSNQPLSRLVIYNRTDIAERNARLEICLSADDKNWEKFYTHDGTVFYGFTDNKPLTVDAGGRSARYVRLQLPGTSYFHLDEVQVFGADGKTNVALRRPATQSSVSPWSAYHAAGGDEGRVASAVRATLRRGELLAKDLGATGLDTAADLREFTSIGASLETLPAAAAPEAWRALYLRSRAAVRALAFRNPLLEFDRLLVNKYVIGSFSHMSDQYFGWWSRPGGGLYVLENIKSGAPRETCLTASFPPGSFLRPMLSWDGARVLFAYCRFYPDVASVANKVDKGNLPEDSFYHLYEMNIDGSGLRQLTRGKYNDFDGRYLPDGRIVFLSTRRGHAVQYGRPQSLLTMDDPARAEAYVRCGGDCGRPCAVYTLHTMSEDGSGITAISPFEMFEWTPAVANDGTILYARWDYIDRSNQPFMKLWRTNPDGTNPSHVFGNYMGHPNTAFEARPVPGSGKIVFTAGAHHSISGGSLVLLDPDRGVDGEAPMTRITPELPFPEAETRGRNLLPHYYASPWPLSEKYHLCAWSHQPLVFQGGANTTNGLGVYYYDLFGNLELLYRDESINTLHPIPVRPIPRPPVLASSLPPDAEPRGQVLVSDIQRSLRKLPDAKITALRVIAVPPKTQPNMNAPEIGLTRDDPGKVVLGTVPVEADGSAYFEAPACVTLFFQALDAEGVAVQTMRSATYLQPGQTLSCVGCHESRQQAAVREQTPIAARRPPSKIRPGPDGSWPMRFDRLVQPVLAGSCASCHEGTDPKQPAFPSDPVKAWKMLTAAKTPSLRDLAVKQYHTPYTTPGETVARRSPLLTHFRDLRVRDKITAADFERLATWLDVYGHYLGHFSDEQERDIERLRREWTGMGLVE